MGLRKSFGTDVTLETKGIIIDYGDFRVTLARAGGQNKKFQRVLEQKTKPFKRAIQTETIDPTVAKTIMLEVYAETIILNWETKVEGKFKQGIELDEGKVLPFTKENVVKTLEELPDLFVDLQQQATSAQLYRQDILDNDAKN